MDDVTADRKNGSLLAGVSIAAGPRTILLCSCEKTMPVDADLIKKLFPNAEVKTAHNLCGADVDRVHDALSSSAPLIIGCTQEAALFSDIAEDRPITFVNLRETAGWSSEASKAVAKQAALLAVSAEIAPEPGFVTMTSKGVVLIYGRDETAIEAADLLSDVLDVTVLMRPPADDILPRSKRNFPIVRGAIRGAKGHLGAFELVIDNYAPPRPSSRGEFVYGSAKDGAVSRCDVILDLSGATPLFHGTGLRDGYLRADPGFKEGVLKAVLKARELVGTFDKPRYIAFNESICAHSRSQIVGCKRCLDLCPAGAITPHGDHVAIDPMICAGCGQCAAACPTGAASYALPALDVSLRRLRSLLLTYREAGGESPVVLFHDEPHGTPLIEALARFGDGLSANVLPVSVNEIAQIGLETIAAAFAYGACALRFLVRGKPSHDLLGLQQTLVLAWPILEGVGLEPARIDIISTDDPFALSASLGDGRTYDPVALPATFLPVGGKREILLLALRELRRVAPKAGDLIALPAGAPFGSVDIEVDRCTLCLSCVPACPTGALRDNPDKPMLRFVEDACVQCGLCKATCPEKVITLTPRLDFSPASAQLRVLKEEEPFRCTRCDTPFAAKSTIDRIATILVGKHWMFQSGDPRLAALTMCADCRMKTAAEAQLARPGVVRHVAKTTDDYLRERDERQKIGKDKDEPGDGQG